jgi:hypothetical protein
MKNLLIYNKIASLTNKLIRDGFVIDGIFYDKYSGFAGLPKLKEKILFIKSDL